MDSVSPSPPYKLATFLKNPWWSTWLLIMGLHGLWAGITWWVGWTRALIYLGWVSLAIGIIPVFAAIFALIDDFCKFAEDTKEITWVVLLAIVLITAPALALPNQAEIDKMEQQIAERVQYMVDRGLTVDPELKSALVLNFDLLAQTHDRVLGTQQAFLKQHDVLRTLAWIGWKGMVIRTLWMLLLWGLLVGWGMVMLWCLGWPTKQRWAMALSCLSLGVAFCLEWSKPTVNEVAFMKLQSPFVYSLNRLHHRTDRLEHDLEHLGVPWWKRWLGTDN